MVALQTDATMAFSLAYPSYRIMQNHPLPTFVKHCLPRHGGLRSFSALTLIILPMILGVAYAQDPTDSLNVRANNYYFSGTLVYTPAGKGVPVRLRMGMGIGLYGTVSARTERTASGQVPFRSWAGSALPEPEQGELAEKFYLHTSGAKFPKAGSDPDHFHDTYKVPDGMVVTGLLQPVNDIFNSVPQLSFGQLNFRLQKHQVTGGGIDPDGSTYAFTLLEQNSEPVADPQQPTVFGPVSDGSLSMAGTLTVTHPDGGIERMAANGQILFGYQGNIYIAVPALLGGTYTSSLFYGQTTRTELRTVGDSMALGDPFTKESSGFVRPADAVKNLLPGVKQIGIAVRYGRLTGGCIADDGTAYSFMLTMNPLTAQ